MAQSKIMPSSQPNLPFLDVAVRLDADGWRRGLATAEAVAARAATAAFGAAFGAGFDGVSPGSPVEISIQLSDDAQVRGLNRDWRDKNTATNVLSFPALEEGTGPVGAEVLLGDVVVAFETTEAEAKEEGKSLADHLSHLVVHGTLHLMGFDHISDNEADIMEALETRILAELGIADPYGEGR